MLANSDSRPAKYTKSRGMTQVAHNIQEVNGIWAYDYVEIEGLVTGAKFLEAMRAKNLETDAGDWTPDGVATRLEDSKAAIRLSNITDMTYAELDTYIQNNVTINIYKCSKFFTIFYKIF